MEEKKHPLKNVKVVVRSSPPALKIALIILIVLSMAALAALRMVHNNILDETRKLKDEASAVEHANTVLDERLKDPDSVQNILDIAQEQLGLVDPDAILIEPQS